MIHFSIALKLIAAMILGVLPFVASYLVKEARKEKQSGIRKIIHYIFRKLPVLHKCYKRCVDFLKRLHTGMKKSDNARKFFHYIIILVLIMLLLIDGLATEGATAIMQKAATGNSAGVSEMIPDYTACYAIYYGIRTSIWATLLTQLLTLAFFFRKYADKILTVIRHNKYVDMLLLTAAALVVITPRCMLLSEAVLVVIMAAQVYPDKISDTHPNGGVRIVKHKRKKLRNAA